MDIKDFAEKLGIDAEKVQSVVSDSGITILNSEEKATFEKNIGLQKFQEGKKAGVNMTFKNLKKSYDGQDNLIAKAFEEAHGFEDVVVNVNRLHDTSVEAKINELKGNYEGNVDERIGALQEKYTSLEQTYQNEKKALQNQYEAEKKQREEENANWGIKLTQFKTDNLLQNEFSALNFEVPADVKAKGNDEVAKFHKIRRDNTVGLFKSRYDAQFSEDGKPFFLDKVTGEKVVDELQNPMQLTDLMKTFISDNYINVVSNREGGRGGEDDYKRNGGLKGIDSMDKFRAYASQKGISTMTTEGVELFKEVKAANPEAEF